MIEINCQKARLLIKCQLDHWLAAEQWTVLQLHLERCQDCRNYQILLRAKERGLRLVLRSRWDLVSGPTLATPQIVLGLLQKQARRRQRLSVIGVFAAISLLSFLLMPAVLRSSAATANLPKTGPAAAGPSPTHLPTAIPQAIPVVKPGQFPHIVAYSATNSGNTDVYLLNPGFEPINITQNPAEDTFPIWSPDGQWLAFLSNRAAPGQEHMKNEIYVMSIAGNYLIQLTSKAMVDWDGPLSWSTDGKWIAASGVLLDNPQERSIYLIGVDGSASYRLSGTQGGSLPKFSPYGDRLAFYQVEENQSRIVIYHVNSGKSTSVDFRPARNNPADVEVSFDWPGDGDGLYYAAGSQVTNSVHVGSQQPCARMEMQQASNNEAWHEKLHDHFHYVKSEKAAVIQNMSWAPNGLVLYTAGAQDFKSSRYETAENYGFPSNHPRKSNNPNISADLCVLGLLDRGSWSLDMQWFIFTAYERGKTDIGLYIIRMPGLDLGWQPGRTTASPGNDLPIGTVLRLTPASINSSAPRMRPIRKIMGIEPRPSRLDFILKADRLAPFGYALGSAYIPFSPRW